MTFDIEIGLFIDGDYTESATGLTLDIYNPATDEVITSVQAAGELDINLAVDAARRAQRPWAARPPRERGAILIRAAHIVRRESERLAHIESLDTGKPLKQAQVDVEIAAQYLEFYGGYADKVYGKTIPLDGSRFAITFPEPLGVTGHIIPWNYPLQIGTRTIAAALATGNTCVVKASEEAPLTTLILPSLLREAGLPRGALNVTTGLGPVAGAALAQSDGIDHISFTGSIDAGSQVMLAAARNIKPVTMELGGKSPSIVLADADLDRVVPTVVNALIQNAGQTCSACSRVVVHKSIHDEVVERIGQRMEAVSIGPGLDNPDMGPLISERQKKGVVSHIEEALAAGASLAVGRTELPGLRGHFMSPTLLTKVDTTMAIANEEVFGPVLAVLSVDDDAEAIEVADSTPYGLVAAVWSRDIDRALSIARNVKAGQVFVNSYGAGGGVALPFGGFKKSGFGREKGTEAVLEFTQVKTIAFDVQEPND